MRKDRIQARLDALGINQFEAAERAGRNANFLYDFLNDRKKSFKGDGPIRLAQVLECSIEYLEGASPDVGKPPLGVLSAVPSAPPYAQFLTVAGVVEAGVFRRPGSSPIPMGDFRLYPHPDYPARGQALFVVRGGGMDARGIIERMVLSAVRVEDAPDALRSGAVVVVERVRANGKDVETSARELQYFPDRVELHARSNTENIPPIVIRSGKTTENGGKVKISHVVLSATLIPY